MNPETPNLRLARLGSQPKKGEYKIKYLETRKRKLALLAALPLLLTVGSVAAYTWLVERSSFTVADSQWAYNTVPTSTSTSCTSVNSTDYSCAVPSTVYPGDTLQFYIAYTQNRPGSSTPAASLATTYPGISITGAHYGEAATAATCSTSGSSTPVAVAQGQYGCAYIITTIANTAAPTTAAHVSIVIGA
jgi:hypothetical protein